MKNILANLLLAVVGVVMVSGCSVVDESTSSVLRTSGLGEEALPLETKHFAIEVSMQDAKILDKINYREYEYAFTDENDIVVTGANIAEPASIWDFKLRLSLSKLSELSLGIVSGKEGATNTYSSTVNGETTENTFNNYTHYKGFTVGYKRLMTKWENPTKLSLFVSGTYIDFSSEGVAEEYDADSFETKAALLFGIHPNLEKRTSYPTFSIYHATANTYRIKTIPGIPKDKNVQTIGSELLYTLKFKATYLAVNGGIEKQLNYNYNDNGVSYHLGFKIGLTIATRKQ